MDLETVKSKIHNLDVRIADIKKQIKNLSDKLEDAQDAQKSAKRLQSDFESFVSRRRQAKDRNIFENGLKSFQSFLNKTKRLLVGEEYGKANDNVEEMLRITTKEVDAISEDLSFCKNELSKLTSEKDELMEKYKALTAENERGTMA